VVILKCKLRSRANTPPDEENFDPQDYQNFDDFAQRSSQAKQGQLFNQPFNSQQSELAMIRSRAN